jgi:hypothetical protein
MRRQVALFVCALTATWLVDVTASRLFGANVSLRGLEFLVLPLPPLACWLVGFRATQVANVLLTGVVGAVGSFAYVAVTWRVWPEPDGHIADDYAGLFELATFLVIWLVVTSVVALLSRLIGRMARPAA